MKARALTAATLLFATTAASAEPADFTIGRYLAKYPAMYATALVSDDPRDSLFDAQGEEVDSVAPTYGNGNAFPEQRATVKLEWHFPFFESEEVPFLSSRTWTARAQLGYARLDTEGDINGEIAARGLEQKGDGLTDVELEFGPLLWGSQDWRSRTRTPFSLMLLGQFRLPFGDRDPNAPNNVGGNVFGYGAKLGAHWQPLSRVLIDAGAAWRTYTKNEEPAFGAQEPSRRGDDLFFDATAAVRLAGSLFASASWYRRDGDPNSYEKVRFTQDAPSAGLGQETFPDPSAQYDDGTLDQRLGVALQWFITPRLNLGAHYVHPLSGRSGEFDQPYLTQQEDCEAFLNCNPQPNGTAHVDGLGPARVYASDYWMLSLNWNFRQGDPWLGGIKP